MELHLPFDSGRIYICTIPKKIELADQDAVR